MQIKEKLDQAKEIEIAIKALVRQNLYTQASPEGILTRDQFAYMRCLKINEDELEKQLAQDKVFWRDSNSQANHI